MLTPILTTLRQPASRRKWLTIISGSLIVLGLIALYGFGLRGLWAASMLAAAFVAGSDIAWRAFHALRIRHFSIELLVTVAAIGALFIGEYWESAAVTFLFSFGAWLEARTLRQTRGALADLLKAAPEVATVIRDGQPVEVAASAVQLGETVLVRAGEPAKAAEVLDAPAFRDRRRETRQLLLLAEAHAGAEQFREAEEAARAAMAQDPDNPLARRMVAALLLRANDQRAAELVLEQGLRTRPADPLLQQTLVQAVRQGRGLDAALETADRLARQEVARPSSLTLRGDLLMGAERFEEAAAAYATAHGQAPSGVLVLRQAGALQRLGKQDEAVQALTAWLERTPDDLAVQSQLSQIQIATGRTDEAERRLVRIVAARPEDAVSLNNLAWLMQARSNTETAEGRTALAQARQYAERAYYLAPSAETADTLGWILARSGEHARAVPLLRQAAAASVARQRPDAAMFYRYAVALEAAGEREEARRVIEPVVASNAQFPERAEAERLLARLRGG